MPARPRTLGPFPLLWLVALVALLLGGAPEAALPATVRLHLRATGSFDPKRQAPRIASDLARSPALAPSRAGLGSQRHWIVQFDGAVRQEWRELLVDAGAQVLSYLPDYAYVIRVADSRLPRVRQLPHLHSVTPFKPAYALSPGLVRTRPGYIPVQIETFLPEDMPAVLTAARRYGARIEATSARDGGTISATMTWSGIRLVAQTFGVAWIEERLPLRTTNDVASDLSNVTQTRPRLGLYGTNQIVAVADTGLDTGDAASIGIGTVGTIHPDFRGRILAAYSVNDRDGGAWSDPDNKDTQGHGTHVVGSVLGSGLASGAIPTTASYAGSHAGVAPEALLVFQSSLNKASDLFATKYRTDFYQLFDEAYALGARIHTNSWGSSAYGGYTTHSRAVDRFMWDHPDLLVLFSAGNDGRDNNSDGVVEAGTMGAPGTAKNCLTIGASENVRSGFTWVWSMFSTAGFTRPQNFPAQPIRDDKVASHRSGMAAFSSRGPCADTRDTSAQGDIYRIKPDLVAPGTAIASTRSQLLTDTYKAWGRLSEFGLADVNTVKNNSYHLSGGTSMSTPLVAGMAALTRQYYQELRNHPVPSAALIKATLLASAVDLFTTTNKGQYSTSGRQEQPVKRPNSVQGWGRVDLRKALDPSQHISDPDAGNTVYSSTRLYFSDVRPGLRTGETDTITLPVANTAPLNVVLAYTDAPPASTASVALVNNLDLDVTTPQGVAHSGNGYASDTRNNVEGVDLAIANLAPGAGGSTNLTITITGTNVPQGPQPYAVVVYGAVPEIRQELRIAPSTTRCQLGRSVQLGALFNGLPTTGVTWQVVSGGGAVSPTGLYTAPASGTQASVRATFGALTATATVLLDPVSSIVLPPIARVEYYHTFPADVVNIHVGLGTDADNPQWTTTFRTGLVGTPALTVEEFDLSAAPTGSLPPTALNRWFVRLQDSYTLADDGEIRVFWIRYNGVTYNGANLPARVPPAAGGDLTTVFIDNGNSSADPTALARVRLTHPRLSDLTEIRVGVGPDKANPIWQSAPQTGPGGSEKLFNLNGAPAAAFPPSADYPWWVKVTDGTLNNNPASIDEFTLLYNGLEFSTNRGASIPAIGTVYAWIDPCPPTIGLTVPGGGASLTNTVTLQAAAADNDAVHRVEFFCDDRLLTTDSTAPYEFAWDTKQETNGNHRLSVKAYDPTGNSTEAFAVVTVGNSTLRPNVVTTLTGWTFDSATRTLTVTATLRNTGPEGSTAWNVTLQRVTLWGIGSSFTGQRPVYLQAGSGNGLPRTFPSILSGATQTLVLKTIVPPEVTSIPRWTSFGYYFDLQTGGNRYYL